MSWDWEDLSGEQIERINGAILSSFARKEDLARFLRFKLDVDLDGIADGPYGHAVFTLINWANAQGRVHELCERALGQVPANPKLKALLDEATSTNEAEGNQSQVIATIEFVLDRPMSEFDPAAFILALDVACGLRPNEVRIASIRSGSTYVTVEGSDEALSRIASTFQKSQGALEAFAASLGLTQVSWVAGGRRFELTVNPANPTQDRAPVEATRDVLALWREKLVFLQKEEAIAADAAQRFNIAKRIEEAKQKIQALTVELGEHVVGPAQLHQAVDEVERNLENWNQNEPPPDVVKGAELAIDLDNEMRHGALLGSRVAFLVVECVRAVAPVNMSEDYDLESLTATIGDADELVRTADELTGKLEGREAAFRAVRRVVVGLAQAIGQSQRQQTLVVDVTEKILSLEEVAIPIQWPPGGKDTFYNAVIWGTGVEIEDLLEEFCEE